MAWLECGVDTIGQKHVLHKTDIIYTFQGVNHKEESAREEVDKRSEQHQLQEQ